MPCSALTPSSRAMAVVQRWLLLALLCFASGCKSTPDWWQGDFTIDVNGKPEPLTHLYVVVGSEAVLQAAQAHAGGFGGVVLGDRAEYTEFYEFKLEADERLGRRWTQNLDEKREGLKRIAEGVDGGLAGQLRLKISRHDFKANAEHRIAIIAKYRSEAPWKGALIPMDQFSSKGRAIVTLSDSELNIYYYD